MMCNTVKRRSAIGLHYSHEIGGEHGVVLPNPGHLMGSLGAEVCDQWTIGGEELNVCYQPQRNAIVSVMMW